MTLHQTPQNTVRHPRSLISLLYNRDGPGCFYCHQPLAAKDATIDHYVAKARGGHNVFSNYRAACQPCNECKGSMKPESFGK